MGELGNFHEIVQSAWNIVVPGDPLQALAGKLRSVKRALSTLNNENGNLASNVEKARDILHDSQNAVSSNPTDLSLLKAQRLHSENLWYALSSEEKFLKQKSRIQWLKDGDKNSGFFYNQIKNRWN